MKNEKFHQIELRMEKQYDETDTCIVAVIVMVCVKA